MDVRLKNFVPKAFWGFQRQQQNVDEPTALNTIAAVNDRKLVLIIGSRLALLDHAETYNSKIISFGPRTVTEIINIVLSVDSKYLAASVKMTESQHATMLIMNDDNQLMSTFRKPRAITYSRSTRFEGISFSNNAELISAFTESQAEGVLIFDRVREVLIRQIPLASAVFAVSFNPENDTRICTTGACNLFQFWRYTNKAVHSAPIVGLIKEDCMYTNHVWLPENRLVAGTDKGLLVLVQGCEVQSTHQAFGTSQGHNYEEDGKVQYLRAHQNFVVAASAINCISVFELKRVVASTSVGNNNHATLVMRGKFHLQGSTELRGLQLNVKRAEGPLEGEGVEATPNEAQSAAAISAISGDFKDWLTIVAALPNSISFFELLLAPAAIIAQNSTDKDGRTLMTTTPTTTKTHPGAMTVDKEPDWKDVQGRNIYDFHCEKIDSIAAAVRSSTFITSSAKDFSIRAWDFNKPFVAGDLVDYFYEHPNDMPLRIDIHPTGLFAAFACNDEVREAAITQSGFEIVRHMPTKLPFVSSDGLSLANSSPVSLVKYAHGGHLLAVACGKIVQLFHMYDLDYHRNKSHAQSDTRGRPKRVMSVVHTTQVSDLTFSTDDSVLYSCSVEGTVLSHAVSCFPGSSPLTGEYVTRGATATKIVTSESKYLIASYVSLVGGGTAESRKTADGTHSNLTAADLASHSYLAVWQGGRLSDSPALIYLEVPAREIAVQTTTALTGGSKVDMCVIGCVDGSVLICLLPLPVSKRVLGSAAAVPTGLTVSSSTPHYHTAELALTGHGHAENLRGPVSGVGSSFSAALAVTGDGAAAAPAGSSSTGAPLLSDPDDTAHLHPRAVDFLDESRCRSFLHHSGPVSGLVITSDSKRIFSAGADGAVFMLQWTKQKKSGGGGHGGADSDSEDEGDSHHIHGSAGANEGLDMGESAFMLANKAVFETMRDKAQEEKFTMEDKIKESVAALAKVSESRDIEVDTLSLQLKREVGKRDAIILREREEHLKQKHKLQNQLKVLEKKRTEEISRVEMSYEQKLATEALYLDRMRQAYEEMVLNARLDRKKAVDTEIESQLRSSADAAFYGKLDAQKQKEALLLYVEYMNARHAEVIASLEKSQEKERSRFKRELATGVQAVIDAKAEGIEKIVMANLNVKQLVSDVATKEDQVLRLKSDLEWSEGRITNLESALQQATSELKKRTEMYEKWEFKAGDQQQQISEMERIRRALTHQLHGLRQAIGPKDEHILRITEKLEEMDREYNQALRAVSEKEVSLSQRSAVLHMLQKQIRDLRVSSSRKEASLQRAAKLFEQYKRSLMEDSTVAGMISNGTLVSGPGVTTKPRTATTVAVSAGPARTDSTLALQRLDDVLKAHIPSAVEAAAAAADNSEPESIQDVDVDTLLAEAEKERQVMQLHKNVNALKTNLEKNELLAAVKVKKHLTDNEHLVQEVNRMRHEIRSLSTENQRLHIALAEVQRATKGRNSAVGRQRDGLRPTSEGAADSAALYASAYMGELQTANAAAGITDWYNYEHSQQQRPQYHDQDATDGTESNGRSSQHNQEGLGRDATVRFEPVREWATNEGSEGREEAMQAQTQTQLAASVGESAGDVGGSHGVVASADSSSAASLPPLGRTGGKDAPMTAEQKINALIASNEDSIRMGRGAGKGTPSEILSYHQRHDEQGFSPHLPFASGTDDQKSVSLRDSLTAGSLGSLRTSSAHTAQLKLNTATIQLPDVSKKGKKQRGGR